MYLNDVQKLQKQIKLACKDSCGSPSSDFPLRALVDKGEKEIHLRMNFNVNLFFPHSSEKNLTLSSFFILKITYLAYSSLMIFRTLLTIFPTAVSDCWAAINCLPSLTTLSMTSLQFTSIMPYRIIPMTLWSYNLISCIFCINFKFFSILFHFS